MASGAMQTIQGGIGGTGGNKAKITEQMRGALEPWGQNDLQANPHENKERPKPGFPGPKHEESKSKHDVSKHRPETNSSTPRSQQHDHNNTENMGSEQTGENGRNPIHMPYLQISHFQSKIASLSKLWPPKKQQRQQCSLPNSPALPTPPPNASNQGGPKKWSRKEEER